MLKIKKTQVINETSNWVCFTPDNEITKGHVCFYSDNTEDDAHAFSKMYGSAVKYGKSMVDIGFYDNYHIYFFDKILHLVPEPVTAIPGDWVKLLTQIDKTVII